TVGWLGSIPRLNSSVATEGVSVRLQEIEGTVPSLRERIPGCAFAPRCHAATQKCREQLPVLEEKSIGHRVACWESDRLRGQHG
ncbi:MAG TPA: peptide ABC transporter ATP-binding protein, partial [Gammaproteobacteria bacterium]|nr:peptide ABC transporter ATP-binding protein [Gammaproteobacteria bacterium]